MNRKLSFMSDVFVGRQPIYDRQLGVVAYELLFRNGEMQHAEVVDGNQATAHVLVNTLLEIGLDTIVGTHTHAFVNFTRDFLLQDYALAFPPDRAVLEVLEDITVDADLIEAIRNLSCQGYTIALDDFIYQEHLCPLVELADIIKIDVLAVDRPTLQEHVSLLQQYEVKLLAEKVETQEDFTYCKDLGFEYFQGYFLCRPDVVKGRRSPASRLSILTLLAKLQDPQIEFHDLEEIISRDVSLSYKILRLANSAFYTRSRPVDSIHQALLRLGLKFISNMVSLMCLTNIGDKPHDLITTAMVRAKMCEQIARAANQSNQAMFFTVGLLSVLDAFLDRPLPEILEALPLAEDLIQALLHHEGFLGETLHCVLAYERGQWEEVIGFSLDHEATLDTYLKAIAWAAEMNDVMTAS